MTLDLLVTHYKEPWETVKPLFDSIAMQRGIDFNDIQIILANDGRDMLLHEKLWRDYPFKVKYIVHKHSGVSATRNFAFDKSEADYVMFCDCDDAFISSYGLHLIFSAMQEGFDTCVSTFVEEQPMENGGMKLLRHDTDATFIHGKVHNRKFLEDNNLRFNNDLTIHEDGFFNCLVQVTSDNTRTITTPFYAWAWNENSVVRKDKENFVLKTYSHLMKTRIALCKELQDRGYINQFYDAVCKTVLDSYYDFNKPEYLNPENETLVKAAEKSFKQFYEKYREYYLECNITRIAEAAQLSRLKAYERGLHIEQRTLNEWLTHIMKEV